MFGRSAKSEDLLDEPIAQVLTEMKMTGPDTEEYPALLSYLERLTNLKTGNRRERVSLDTMLIVAGNLAGILIIVAYEQKHAMVSTAKNFLLKPK